jgi:hypothetical protein
MPAVARRSHGVATSATVSGPFVVALVVHPVHHIGCYGTRPRRSTEESSSELDSVSKFDIKISASLQFLGHTRPLRQFALSWAAKYIVFCKEKRHGML